MSRGCEHPVTLAVDPPTMDVCGKPAVWETQDLKEVHHLCDEHCTEALLWNDFTRDAL